MSESESEAQDAVDPVQVVFDLTNDAGLERLAQRDAGPYNFVDAMESVRAVRAMASSANEQDPSFVPNTWHEQWKGQFVAFGETLRRVEAFSPIDDPTPNDTHRTLVNEIDQHRNWFATNVAPLIRATGEIDDAARTAAAQEAATTAEQAAGETMEILSRLKRDVGQSSAGELAEYYDKQAGVHKNEARWALAATIFALVAFALFIAAFFWWWPIPQAEVDESQWEQFVRGLAPRLLVLGLAGYALAFFSRNYRVARHQQAVNEHKRNALRTYNRFLGSVSEGERDIITAELVRRVFENVETGYIGSENEKTIVETSPTLLSSLRPQ